MTGRPVRIALAAGESSGDQLGAPLVRALRTRWPDCEFAGVGGPLMREAGLEAWNDCSELAVMGITEVLVHLPRLWSLRRRLLRRLLAWRPDVFVGIDAPDFNLGLEKRLKRRGIATVHYVSPSVWAWRPQRAARIGEAADRVLCLFPFEPPIYARHGVDARFVGHPIADRFALEPDRASARARLDLPLDRPVLAVLPGSRVEEVRRLAPEFIGAIQRLHQTMPELHVVAPMASAACRLEFAAAESLAGVRLLDGEAHAALVASDVALLASGTAALEALLAKRPMVVAYRIAAPTHWLVRRLGMLRLQRYSLPNILAGETLVPELMQRQCRAEPIAASVLEWFSSPDAVAALVPRFEKIHRALQGGGSQAAAGAVAELVASR